MRRRDRVHWRASLRPIAFRGDEPERLIPGILVDDLEIALLAAGAVVIGVGLTSGEGDPLAVGGNLVGSDATFEVGEEFGFAAIDGDAIDLILGAAIGGEIHVAPIGGELGLHRALLGIGELNPLRAVGLREEDLIDVLALFGFHDGVAFGPDGPLAIG